MAFSSQLYPGEKIFDDDSDEADGLVPEGHERGYMPELRGPEGYAGSASPFPDELLIPESEWQARIQEMEERKTRNSDLIIQSGLPCKNQQRTNYCWINAPTHAVECLRVLQGESPVILSPASVGAVLKNYKNVGGWGGDALQGLINLGLVPVEFWPANAIDKQYDTPETRKMRENFKVIEWYELKPRNFKQQVSALLRRMLVPVGLNYWGHEVLDVDAAWLDGEAVIRFRNSYGMDWPNQGAGGWSIRRGSKKFADDAVVPRTTTLAA